MNYILIGLGAWIALDGAYSMYEYRTQTPQEQIIRVIRMGVGATVAYLGWTL